MQFGDVDEAVWRDVLARAPEAAGAMPLYAPLLDGPLVLGRIAQTLDGKIATANGASFWISGPEDVRHTHRLRALFDAVIVGAGTIRADDPLLTTRLCVGPSPVRVVLDTELSLTGGHRVFSDGLPTLLMCADDRAATLMRGTTEVVGVPRAGRGLDLAAVVGELRQRGLARLYIEGGGVTVSRFLVAGLLDRLHVTVAPLLLGDGVPAFTLPGVARPENGLRLDWTVHRLGSDVLFDIPLRRTMG